MSTLDIDHVRTFRAIVETGSFGRAAKVLHLSQSAVTGHVQQLEGRLGLALFERYRRGQTRALSAAGESFAPEARRLLRTHDGIVDAFSGPVRRSITVGFNPVTIDSPIIDRLGVLSRGESPAYELKYRIGSSFALRRAIEAADADVAVLTDFGGDVSDEDVIEEVPLGWFATPGFRLPARGETLTVITYADEPELNDRGLELLEGEGWHLDLSCRTTDAGSAAAAGRAGIGVVLLAGSTPCFVMRELPELPRVVGLRTRLTARTGLPAEVREAFRNALAAA